MTKQGMPAGSRDSEEDLPQSFSCVHDLIASFKLRVGALLYGMRPTKDTGFVDAQTHISCARTKANEP